MTSSAFGSYQYPRSISVKVATGIEHQILEIKDFHFLVCCSLIRDTSSVKVVQLKHRLEEIRKKIHNPISICLRYHIWLIRMDMIRIDIPVTTIIQNDVKVAFKSKNRHNAKSICLLKTFMLNILENYHENLILVIFQNWHCDQIQNVSYLRICIRCTLFSVPLSFTFTINTSLQFFVVFSKLIYNAKSKVQICGHNSSETEATLALMER